MPTPEIQAPQPGPIGLLARAIDLHEKASMAWPDAERLALSEAGVDDAEIDEVVGEAGGLEMLLTKPEDLRDFARSVLVHGSHRISTGPTVDLRAIAKQAGMRVDLLSMGAASMVYSDGCEGVTREHLEKFAALYGFACWNAALAANPPNMQGFVGRAIDSLFQAPEGGQPATGDVWLKHDDDLRFVARVLSGGLQAPAEDIKAAREIVHGLRTTARSHVQAPAEGETLAEGDRLRIEHLAFMAWARPKGFRLDRTTSPGCVSYADNVTAVAWGAWLARAASAARANVQPKGKSEFLSNEWYDACIPEPTVLGAGGGYKHYKRADVEWAVRAAVAAYASQAPAPAPEGWALAPDYRGYAHLGTGQYVLNHSAAGEPPEVIISLATEEEKAGRAIGEERPNPPGHVLQPDEMAVRLRFASPAGLEALEREIQKMRETHGWAVPCAAVAPAGWKLVPVEPTREMIAATDACAGIRTINNVLALHAARTGLREFPGCGETPEESPVAQAYRAMLAAAPTPSHVPVQPMGDAP